jgi:hypothetical protein
MKLLHPRQACKVACPTTDSPTDSIVLVDLPAEILAESRVELFFYAWASDPMLHCTKVDW